MMRPAVLLLVLGLGGWWGAFQRVHDANEAQLRGAAAYARGDFAQAAAAYDRARALGSRSAELYLNLGHAYLRAGQRRQAREAYGQVLPLAPPELRSQARQQLAGLAAAAGNYPQALTLLRQALVDNPLNAAARYNYELLRPYQGRRTPPQLPPPPPQPAAGGGQAKQPTSSGQAPPAPTPGGQGNASGGGRNQPGAGPQRPMPQGAAGGRTEGQAANEAGTEPGNGRTPSGEAATATDNRLITRQPAAVTNISEAQAEQLLDALRAAEQQYLQQIPHPPTRRPDPRKPAW
jgi:tetratricopeptide (TPR) repeat protein